MLQCLQYISNFDINSFFHVCLKTDWYVHKQHSCASSLKTSLVTGMKFATLIHCCTGKHQKARLHKACNLIKDCFMIHVHGKLKMFPLFYQQRICCKVNNQFMFPTNLVLASFKAKTQIDSFVSVVTMYQLRYPKNDRFS